VIVAIARTWIDTPFHHQGRVKNVGVDCAGLIIKVGHELGLLDFDVSNYGREPAKEMMQHYLNKYFERITKLEDGCILLMKFVTEPQHLAIYTKDNTIIHAYQSVKKCVEHTFNDKWAKRVVAMYRYP